MFIRLSSSSPVFSFFSTSLRCEENQHCGDGLHSYDTRYTVHKMAGVFFVSFLGFIDSLLAGGSTGCAGIKTISCKTYTWFPHDSDSSKLTDVKISNTATLTREDLGYKAITLDGSSGHIWKWWILSVSNCKRWRMAGFIPDWKKDALRWETE